MKAKNHGTHKERSQTYYNLIELSICSNVDKYVCLANYIRIPITTSKGSHLTELPKEAFASTDVDIRNLGESPKHSLDSWFNSLPIFRSIFIEWWSFLVSNVCAAFRLHAMLFNVARVTITMLRVTNRGAATTVSVTLAQQRLVVFSGRVMSTTVCIFWKVWYNFERIYHQLAYFSWEDEIICSSNDNGLFGIKQSQRLKSTWAK